MSMTFVCPYCGSDPQRASLVRDGDGHAAADPLTDEIRRIREIAESQHSSAEEQTIERLSREVVKLRETVARLRGCTAHPPTHHDGSVLAAPAAANGR